MTQHWSRTHLSRDAGVSTVVECTDTMINIQNMVIIEYIGTYPQTSAPHGNTKKIYTGDNVRTAYNVKRKLDDLVKESKTPRDVYEEIVLEDLCS